MTKKITITLDDEILAFVDQQAEAWETKANRSAFINAILTEARRKHIQAELEAAYRRDAEDTTYREEIEMWDTVAGDGIDA